MKILAVDRYFWPDNAHYAVALKHMTERWHADGHRVDVLAGVPSYRASRGQASVAFDEPSGVQVRRLNLPRESGRPVIRIVNALRLCAAMLVQALARRYDVIVISTVPPVIGGFCAALAARMTGARLIYVCMDIHPEIGRISGEFKNRFVFGLLQKMDSFTCANARPVVVLSQDMRNALCERRHSERWSIEVRNNFSLPDQGSTSSSRIALDNGKFHVAYTGNLGRFQGLETIIHAMALLSHRDDIEFTFMGDGQERARLEAMAESSGGNIRFLAPGSVSDVKRLLSQVSLGYVSLIPGTYRYAYPSKVATYLEAGCPLLASVEERSSLARDLQRYQCGFVVPQGDADQLKHSLEKLADDRSWEEPMKLAARRRHARAHDVNAALDWWANLIGHA